MAVAAGLDGAITCGSPAAEVTAVGVPAAAAVAVAAGVPPTTKTTTRMGSAASAAAMPTTRLTGPAPLVVQRGEGPLPGPPRRRRRRAAAAAPRSGLRAGGAWPETGAGKSRAVPGRARFADAGRAAGGADTALSSPPSCDQPTWPCTAAHGVQPGLAQLEARQFAGRARGRRGPADHPLIHAQILGQLAGGDDLAVGDTGPGDRGVEGRPVDPPLMADLAGPGDHAGGAQVRDRVHPADLHPVGELLRGEDVRAAAAGRSLGHGGEDHVAGLLVRCSRDLKCLTSSRPTATLPVRKAGPLPSRSVANPYSRLMYIKAVSGH